MNVKPKVSIITACYNSAETIAETITSVLQQTFTDWEMIIVDDRSCDNSPEVAGEFARQDERVKFFLRHSGIKGACVCRNEGVEKSTGSLLIFLDSDDLLAPFCLEQRVNTFLNNSSNDFIIFSTLVFRTRLTDTLYYWNVDTKENDLCRFLRADSLMPISGLLWRKESFIRLGMWDEKLFVWQDIDLHLRALLLGYRYIKKMDLTPDVYIRALENSMSRKDFNAPDKLGSRLRILIKVLQILPKSEISADLKLNIRLMFGQIYLPAVKTNKLEIAFRSLKLCFKYNIVSVPELFILLQYLFFYVSRLRKFPLIRRWIEKVDFSFNNKSTIGKIAYKIAKVTV